MSNSPLPGVEGCAELERMEPAGSFARIWAQAKAIERTVRATKQRVIEKVAKERDPGMCRSVLMRDAYTAPRVNEIQESGLCTSRHLRGAFGAAASVFGIVWSAIGLGQRREGWEGGQAVLRAEALGD
eukprot:CAMPEP_0114547858 /NCGR_PEP_ID=MMETSP0114-20121206/4679_1 /TAXON_ID=31324 /ORGANISM="Goniomonas sp, Strain m" /LENGTH=127 /DNA_ID=CAMNT_0001732423 /DNA_START=83 /DNA_END=467 /DNA_ORIENTATION=-